MPKMTLLEIVQDILNDTNGDEVNDIYDTIESTQVANIVKSTYYEIIHGKDWPHLKTLVTLTGLGDTTKPNYMQVPTNTNRITTLKYNKRKSTDTYDKYEDVMYRSPEEFLSYVSQRRSDASNVVTVSDASGVKLYIRNDVSPTYWTSFDDNNIVFDSYDSVVDTTMQSSKTQVFSIKEPTWTMDKDFYPDLPAEAFSYLLAECKSTVFMDLRQTPNSKEEQKSTRQRRRLATKKAKTIDEIVFKSYGRK